MSKSDEDLAIFKVKRNAANRLMSTARREFYTSFIEENSGDQRKLFNASKRLFGKHGDDGFPPNLDCEIFANDIGNYFVQKIANIRRQLDNDNMHSSPEDLRNVAASPAIERSVQLFSEFSILTELDVKALIGRAALKACPLDPMPSKLVSQCDILLPVLTRIINLSLQTGHFPLAWKEALVHPLLKKYGLEATFKNFRPVSNLPFVSKLTERAVSDQVHVHMVTNDLYPSAQSSYRRNHSTETALLKVKNDLLMNMNKQHVSLLVLLDMSAAFDTVDHGIMLERLSSKLGLSGTVISWFQSYLSERSQRVSIRGSVSEKFDVRYGVPQGSCLGPLLFTIYASKLFDVIQSHLPDAHCYADDTQLYVSFSPKEECDKLVAVTAMERCIEDIRKWMSEDKLLLNADKTDFLLIGTKQQLAKVNLSHISVGASEVAPQSAARNLGVWFDSNLSMSTHISKTSSSGFYFLYNIRRIRKYLTRELTETLIHAFISSRVDYCNSLLYGLPKCQLNKLQRVQNAAARLVFQESKYCRISPLLRSLHWLPVKYRIDFKVLLLTFKAIHGMAPQYLSNLISLKEFTGYNLRSSNSMLLSTPTCKSFKTLGDRAFCMAAPTLWNSLPYSVRSCTSVDSFKQSVKTFLFRQAFA